MSAIHPARSAACACVLVVSACGAVPLRGNGPIVTVDAAVDVGAVRSLVASDGWIVQVVTGPASSSAALELSVEENLTDEVDVTVDGSVLSVGFGSDVDPTAAPVARLEVPAICSAEATGSAQVEIGFEGTADPCLDLSLIHI